MSEFALIDRFFKRVPRDAAVRIGIGDDAAVITPSAGIFCKGRIRSVLATRRSP